MFWAQFSFDLVTSLTFDLLIFVVSQALSFIRPTHIPISSSLPFIRSWVMCDSIWSQYHHMERSLHMRRVICHITGGKIDPHFKNPWSQFTYSLCHFQGATTKIKPCYRRKIAFIPLWRLQTSTCMHSITWPMHMGSPKTMRNNFLTQNYLYNYLYRIHSTIFMGLRWRLRVY